MELRALWLLCCCFCCCGRAADPRATFTATEPRSRERQAAAFRESLHRHRYLNSVFPGENSSAVYGINQFSHLFPEEFKAIYLRSKPSRLPRYRAEVQTSIPNVSLPLRFDWRDKRVVTPVRNQQTVSFGSCCCCCCCCCFSLFKYFYLFNKIQLIDPEFRKSVRQYLIMSTRYMTYILTPCHLMEMVDVIAAECPGRNKKEVGTLPKNRSPVQCTVTAYQKLLGTHQGQARMVWSLASTHVKLVRDSEYPFKAQNGLCRYFSDSHFGFSIKGYSAYDFSDQEDEMAKALVTFGPLVVVVDAVSWQDYLGGIIQHHCSSGEANHAVLITGFDKIGNPPYWIVRNSWGSSWGVDGYAHVKMGGNICGIADSVSAVFV
uniref:cathepsin O n=1 Tax=Panthera onca TaxID=9690 RepID=UPI0029545239|nr:cathepsin O [Panthera onca]